MPADLKALTEELAKALTENPTEVMVVEEGDSDCVYLDLEVAESDMGRIIGKNGRTAKALRNILSAAADRDGRRCSLDILD
jgi:uncharacterized protein